MEGIDFAEGINPKQFILEMYGVFSHQIYQEAPVIVHSKDKSVVSACAAHLAGGVGNYFLILSCMRGRMPSPEGEQLLEDLVSKMSVLVEKGLTFEAGKEVGVMVDEMRDSYSELHKYMKAQPS